MGIIHRLPDHEIKKIAAGEVVERPANIVKELVENSLDAGATTIAIHVGDGGRSSIRIIDNGSGMSRDDAYLCFEQHATSKITSVEDLSTVATYGFRGEALSSIAAVSEVLLITKSADNAEALSLELEYGIVVSETAVAAPQGTDLTINNIFGNIPARKKFLKAKETEWNQIVLLFQAFCLTYPGVHFSLYHDDRSVNTCPPVDHARDRVTQLWNAGLSKALLTVEGADESIGARVRGLASNHEYARYGRNQIFFFVNNRWVKNSKLSRALVRAYSNVHQAGKFPAAFIFIDIDPLQVDVNIHPRKEEVQFLHSRKVELIIQNSVKRSLESNISSMFSTSKVTPSQSMRVEEMADPFGEKAPVDQSKALFDTKSGEISFGRSEVDRWPTAQVSAVSSNATHPKLNEIAPNSAQQSSGIQIDATKKTLAVDQKLQQLFGPTQGDIVSPAKGESFKLIGQLFKTYIVIEKDKEMVLVDQHAAHERVLYEQFASKFSEIVTVNLMFPQTVRFTPGEYSLLEPHLPFFAEHGITAEPFGDHQIVIKSAPVIIRDIDLQEFMKTVVGWLEELGTLDHDAFRKHMSERVHAQMACKAAVKANDVLDEQQMLEVVRMLQESDNRLTCPHGRPTIVSFDQAMIEKQFKRNYPGKQSSSF